MTKFNTTNDSELIEQSSELTMDDDLSFISPEQSKYKKFYFVKMYTKKGTEPHFEYKRLIDGKVVPIKSTTKTLVGTLKKITFSSYEYEGNTLKTVRFLLESINGDGEPVGFSWGCGYNTVLLNLINCILSVNEPIITLFIEVYTDIKSGYNKSKIRINNNKPVWKYSLDQLNDKREKIYSKSGVLVKTESTELFNFMENELQKHLFVILPDFHPDFITHITDKIEDDGQNDVDEFAKEFQDTEVVDKSKTRKTKK